MSKSIVDQYDKADLDALLTYRMFASVDISGSTAFKHAKRKTWIKVFEQFFEDFPSRIQESWERIPSEARGRPKAPFQVWKYVGDEILFVADLACHEEALWHSHVLLSAVDSYEPELRKQPHLGLKACMWTAGFPVANSEVQLHRATDFGDKIDDFLGPDIDLGFRIAGFADRRRVPINIQLVYLLQRAKSNLVQSQDYHPCISYSSSEVLKGVLGNKPYPIFWIDRHKGELTAEDELLGNNHKIDSGSIDRFVIEFIEENIPDIRYPFIVTDNDQTISQPTKDVYEQLIELISNDPDSSYSRSENAEDSGASPSSLPDIQVPSKLKAGQSKASGS